MQDLKNIKIAIVAWAMSVCRWRWSSANNSIPLVLTSAPNASSSCARVSSIPGKPLQRNWHRPQKLRFTDDLEALGERSVFIISVPTPVDEHKRPDFTSLIKTSQTVGKALKRGDVVVYESTVYPGATEEICVPELERVFGMHFHTDFTVGYSP